ncbi:MAG: hypothetical protein ACOYMW_01575 [Candidatus Competibacteraceae bacterium]
MSGPKTSSYTLADDLAIRAERRATHERRLREQRERRLQQLQKRLAGLQRQQKALQQTLQKAQSRYPSIKFIQPPAWSASADDPDRLEQHINRFETELSQYSIELVRQSSAAEVEMQRRQELQVAVRYSEGQLAELHAQARETAQRYPRERVQVVLPVIDHPVSGRSEELRAYLSRLEQAIHQGREALAQEQQRAQRDERRRRELEEDIHHARAELELLKQHADQVVSDHSEESVQVTLEEIPELASDQLADLIAYLETVQSLLRRGRHRLEAEVSRVQANSAMRHALRLLVDAHDAPLRTATDLLESVLRPVAAESALETVTATLDRVLARLTTLPVEQTATLSGLAAKVRAATDPVLQDALLMELRWQAQQLVREQRERLRQMEQARECLVKLPEPENVEENRIVQAVHAAAEGHAPWSETLRQTAAAFQEQGQTRIRQRAVAEILSESLEELGYEVDRGFSTLFVEGGVVHVQRPSWGDYYVRLRVNAGEQHLNFNLIRIAEPGSDNTRELQRRDQEMEETWCPDYYQLMQRLNEQGIRNQRVRAQLPGSLPVQVVSDSAIPGHAQRQQRQTTPALKTRSVPTR